MGVGRVTRRMLEESDQLVGHVERVASTLRGCYEEIAKKLLPLNLSIMKLNYLNRKI